MIRALAPLLMALASPAGAFELAFPAGCTLGQDCYIQQYHDHDLGPEATDYTCGPLSYDGHDGTDIALPTRAAMAGGVAVLAAAPGVVKGQRDGVADAAPFPTGQDCGNGVVIDHGNGYETQYCHLKQGSVQVKTGEPVTTGTPLGLIGQSGQAEFPHLHFSVRRDGAKIDPFSPEATTCGAAGNDLWARDLVHQPGGILGLGLTDQVPAFDAIKAGLPSPNLPTTAPALVVWAYVFGPRAGDAILFELIGPEGAVVTERVQIEKTQALAFRAVGRKLTLPAWPPGTYTATATLMRDRVELSRQELTLTMTP
jgi:hypothetical protein